MPKKDGTVHHPLVTDTRSLLWLANQNSITPHVWTSRAPNLYHPDICVFDLDPSRRRAGRAARGGARASRSADELGLPSWVKTSGSKGFHIVVPLDGKADFGEVARFAHAVGAILVKRDPEHLTQEFSKADRGGRILVDTGRNGYSATFAAAYAVRAKPGAPVSAPCTWEELERGEVGPRTFTLRTMAARIAEVGDLWSDMLKRRRSLRRPMERVRRIQRAGGRRQKAGRQEKARKAEGRLKELRPKPRSSAFRFLPSAFCFCLCLQVGTIQQPVTAPVTGFESPPSRAAGVPPASAGCRRRFAGSADSAHRRRDRHRL